MSLASNLLNRYFEHKQVVPMIHYYLEYHKGDVKRVVHLFTAETPSDALEHAQYFISHNFDKSTLEKQNAYFVVKLDNRS